MLDVHAPEHRVSGARDFFIHLFTITVGLLIALGLENAAEALHHRHQRREAEVNIRRELQQNRAEMQKIAPQVVQEGKDLLVLLEALEKRGTGAQLPSLEGIKIGFNEEPIPDAAWRTASTTGVLNYMEYDEAEAYAEAYKQQDMLQTAEENALNDYLEFLPILHVHGKDLTPDQARDAVPIVRHAIAHVNGMLALGQGTLQAYDAALKP